MPAGSWPPRWLTKVPVGDRRRGDGEIYSTFADSYCRITKQVVSGSVGDLIVLRGWQRELNGYLFARGRDGRRKHRSALVGMARKNGKTAIGASIALGGLLLEGDGAEVYACAGDKDQARILFGDAKRMVELDPELESLTKVYRDAIEVAGSGSVFRVLSSDAPLKEGLSPTTVLFDELHVQPNRELWDVMNLGSGARVEPLVVAITTAGARTDSLGNDTVCYDLYQHGVRCARGEVVDPTFFFAWWEPRLGAEADHADPGVWGEANPGLGDLVAVEDFEAVLPRTPEGEFRTKRTNVWVTAVDRALPHGAWDRLADRGRVVEPGDPRVLGFDGSYRSDSTGLVGCTPDGHLFVVGAWEAPPDDEHWRVNTQDVKATVLGVFAASNVSEIACDPYRWQDVIAQLVDELGEERVIEWPTNSLARMIPAWQKFYDAVMDGRLSHDGDPRLARHIENVVLKRDARGTRPTKEHKTSKRHIDLAVCAVIAYDRATARPEVQVEVLSGSLMA